MLKEEWKIVVLDDDRKDVHSRKFEMTRGEALQFVTDMAGEYNPRHMLELWSAQRDRREMNIRGKAPMRWVHLTRPQQKLFEWAGRITARDGTDVRDFLIAQDALAKDKAAVADLLGALGAGDEFRREHISKRGRCRICGRSGFYYDGIRDPLWVHDDPFFVPEDGVRDHPFEPNDAKTRPVFEKTGGARRRTA